MRLTRPAPRHADLPRPRRARPPSTATCSASRSSSDGVNDDDPGTRHFWFGDAQGTPGTLVTFLEYPQMEAGVDRRRLDAPRRVHGRVGRRAARLARLPARAEASSAPRCSTAARSARSTCAIPTPTSSRSPRAGRAEPDPARGDRRRSDGRRARARRPRPAAGRTRVDRRVRVELRGERVPLALGQRPDRLRLRDAEHRRRNLRQRVPPQRRWLISRSRDRHARRLPRGGEDHLGGVSLAVGDPALRAPRARGARGWHAQGPAGAAAPGTSSATRPSALFLPASVR